MWAAEADILAVLGANSTYREMVAQYALLGDPLMVLDAGEPELDVTLVGGGGEPIVDEVDLVALDASNLRQLQITARDEAGIDRIEILDESGTDLSASLSTEVLPAGVQDHQQVRFDLEIPIDPHDYQLTVKVFDSGGSLETDRHYQLILNMAQTSEFTVDAEVIDPDTYVFPPDEPIAFIGAVTGSSWFTEEMVMELSSDNLDLSNVVFNLDKSLEMTMQFTAVAPAGTSGDRSVVLDINGHETTYMLQAVGAQLPLPEISNVINFPNPMVDNTRFIFESGASGGQGLIRVFSVGGRNVAGIKFQFNGGGSGIVQWDGRDSDGDQLGNGTYLYRIEMDTPAGNITSDMQRLVIMR